MNRGPTLEDEMSMLAFKKPPVVFVVLKTIHVQAFNGALQSVPAIVVAFFAGPLSDRYARKPFILLSIAGYIILNAIFLINSYWFYELKVKLRYWHY